MFELKFSPVVIKHLGLSMYSTLPPVLTELITNSYDADASEVTITVDQQAKSIEILDDGYGMSADELNTDFLNIGKNKRKTGSSTSLKYNRKVTGKKGIGKLSVFGICKEIYVESCKDGYVNAFKMNYNTLINRPEDDITPLRLETIIDNKSVNEESYTKIILKDLTRVTNVAIIRTANSILTRLNIFDENFKCIIKDASNEKELTSDNRTALIEEGRQFYWNLPEAFDDLDVNENTKAYFLANNITGRIITTYETIKEPFKGITLYARGKLANNPEFYDVKLSNSHAFSYMNGSVFIDYMDENSEQDNISTARNSLIWENAEAATLRSHLYEIIKQIGKVWRERRVEARTNDLERIHNVNTSWYESTVQSGPDKKLAKKITDIVLSSNMDVNKTKELLNYVEGAFEFQVFKEYASDMEDEANADELLKLLKDWEVIEAKEHYRLSIGRIETIEKFDTLIRNNTLEVARAGIETMHSFLNKFPWLLEPRLSSFDDEVTYKRFLQEEFNESGVLEEDRRIDFLCKGGTDVLYIIEIKRSQKIIGLAELDQIKAYQRFILSKLEDNDRGYTTVKAYIIGKESSPRKDVQMEIDEAKQHNRFVLNYSQMLSQAKKYHKDFIDTYEATNRLTQIAISSDS